MSESLYAATFMGNAIVDCLTHVTDDVLHANSMNKADFCHFEPQDFSTLYSSLDIEKFQSGGACANTAALLAQLGNKVGYIGRMGADPAGRHFYKDMHTAGITLAKPDNSARTMEIIVLITPDGERTFAEPGVTAPLSPQYIDEDMIRASKWLVIEGYLLLDQFEAVEHAVKIAKNAGIMVALTLAPPFVLHKSAAEFRKIVAHGIDLLFSDEDEFDAFHSQIAASDVQEDATFAQNYAKTCKVITMGPKGAKFVATDGTETVVPTEPVAKVVDATGAGDTFAAGFLHSYVQGEDMEACLTHGHKLARQVVQQTGARLVV